MSLEVGASPVEVLHRFYYWLDECRYDDMATLLCPDGVWLRQGKELRGPGELVQALRLRSTTARVRHVLTNGFAEMAADGMAVVHLYQTVYKDPDPTRGEVSTISGPTQISVVSARLRRPGRDKWLIAHLQSRRQFNFGAAG